MTAVGASCPGAEATRTRPFFPNVPCLARRHHRRQMAPPVRFDPLHSGTALMRHRAKQGPCKAVAKARQPANPFITDEDLDLLARTARLADSSAGLTQPHPNFGCIITNPEGRIVSEAYLWAQGTESAEAQAAAKAGAAACGGTAYLNLEPGDCHGEDAAVQALVGSGVARVVLGMRHPMPHVRGSAVEALRRAGIVVQVLGEAPCSAGGEGAAGAALDACLAVNAPLLHRVVARKPMGVLKYAMTLDGKIATTQGHSAWVSSSASRQRVFEVRARSDAVIVGGQTVRRDDPRLTTRREGGHQPARIVMSRTLDLPENANLWDASHAPTIVMTQRGARRPFQRSLRARGVEVVEFDFLTPEAVARYCAERGYLQCLWECGGMLAAPAIAGGAIHRVMAFVAPKLIGGSRAPTPVGDLGFVEMTQALELQDTHWEPSGPDVLMTGYLPQTGGLRALAAAAGVLGPEFAVAPPGAAAATALPGAPTPTISAVAAATAVAAPGSAAVVGSSLSKWVSAPAGSRVAEFYKAWDRHGSLSNFSPHAICMPPGPMTPARLRALLREVPEGLETCGLGNSGGGGEEEASGSEGPGEALSGSRQWASVEHYYQAQKFTGVEHPDALALVEAIAAAASPEEAAGLGRRHQLTRSELVREDWDRSKLAAMYAAVRAKFATHDGPRRMLLSSAGPAWALAAAEGPAGAAAGVGSSCSSVDEEGQQQAVVLVESSPHDFFWGRGYDGSGQNMLGRLLMTLRDEMVKDV